MLIKKRVCRPENIFKNVGIWGEKIVGMPVLKTRPSWNPALLPCLLTPRHKKAAAFGANPKSPNLARYMKCRFLPYQLYKQIWRNSAIRKM